MSKKSRREARTGRSPANRNREAFPRRIHEPPPDLKFRLEILAAAIGILVVGLGAGLIAFAAFASAGPQALPAGTQVFAENDHTHVTGPVTYDRNPPAGGPHNPVPLNCGVYDQPVPNENAVHSLEHGTVWVTYRPSLSADQVATLQSLVTSSYVGTERYMLLSPYPNLPAPIVASAWGYQLQLQQAGDPRLAQFIHRFAGGSQGGEPGGFCTGGVGTPIE